MAEAPVALAGAKNLSSALADHLAEMIVSGDLLPGERLVQTELAAQFSVSRVAVRDALNKLRQKGLAVDIPRRGNIVRPVSCKAVRDLFAIRQVVEPLAVICACPRLSSQDLATLAELINEQEALADSPELAQVIAKDWEFHLAIYQRCDNPPLMEIIAMLWSRIRQARNLARADLAWGQGWAQRSAARHARVLQALIEDNAAEAARLVGENIGQAADELVAGLSEAGWGETTSGDEGNL